MLRAKKEFITKKLFEREFISGVRKVVGEVSIQVRRSTGKVVNFSISLPRFSWTIGGPDLKELYKVVQERLNKESVLKWQSCLDVCLQKNIGHLGFRVAERIHILGDYSLLVGEVKLGRKARKIQGWRCISTFHKGQYKPGNFRGYNGNREDRASLIKDTPENRKRIEKFAKQVEKIMSQIGTLIKQRKFDSILQLKSH